MLRSGDMLLSAFTALAVATIPKSCAMWYVACMEWLLANVAEILLGSLLGSAVILGVQVGIRYILRKRLSSDVETAYLKLRLVCEPDMLNQDFPDNPTFFKADARDFVNPLASRLRRAGFYPPTKCGIEDASLQE